MHNWCFDEFPSVIPLTFSNTTELPSPAPVLNLGPISLFLALPFEPVLILIVRTWNENDHTTDE